MNEKAFADIFSRPPEGNKKYIFLVDDEALDNKIIYSGYYSMLIQDKEAAERYIAPIIDGLTKGYVKDFVFLPAKIKKTLSDIFTTELENDDIPIDKEAYKIFYNKPYASWNDKQVKEAIDKYIDIYTGNTGKNKNHSLDMVTMDKAEEKRPEWLIMDYIPKNQITTIAGDGGSGKTTMWCAIAAAVSRGEYWYLLDDYPFDNEPDKPQKVMFFSAEDSYEYTLKRRLRKSGAVLENIMTIDLADDRFKDIKFDSEYLEMLVAEHRPTLLIFDPIQAFLDSNVRMGERNAMRSSLAPLAGFGKKYGCTTLIVVHSNKQSGVWGRKRIADSADIWDISRSVLMVGETDQKGVRYLSHEKSNYGKTADTVLFSIADDVIEIKGKTQQKDKDFVDKHIYNTRQAPRLEEAKEFICDFLKDGMQTAKDLNALASAEGVTPKTLRNAKEALTKDGVIKKVSQGYGKEKKHYYALKDNTMTQENNIPLQLEIKGANK